MNGWTIFLCVLVVLFLIGQIRVGCSAEYDAQGIGVCIHVGPACIRVFPRKASTKKEEKTKKAKKEKPVKEKKEKPKESIPLTEKVGGALEDVQELLPVLLNALGYFWKKLSVDVLRLEMISGGSDPADAALRFGQASAALGALWYPLVDALDVKDGYARVVPDLNAAEMTLRANVKLTLKIGQILWFAVYFDVQALLRFLCIYRAQAKRKKQRKAD